MSIAKEIQGNRSPASIILEMARQRYPKHTFLILAQDGNASEITTNAKPSEIPFILRDALEASLDTPIYKKRKPEL